MVLLSTIQRQIINRDRKHHNMKVSVLGSSSMGNTTFIETLHHKILVDAGFSGKKIKELLESINRSIEEIDTIFVTHEHSDHIKGLGVLMRKYDLNVYANSGTWDAILNKPSMGKIPNDKIRLIEPNQTISLDDLDVNSFTVSHDATEPQFYQFMNDNHRFCVLTDTGYVSENVKNQIKGADSYLLEFNHDMTMLREGPYSWSLKQRILSDSGHLSNDSGAEAMIDLLDRHTKKVFLGHLSPENNTKNAAHDTAYEKCLEIEPEVNSNFEILNTDRLNAQPLFTV